MEFRDNIKSVSPLIDKVNNIVASWLIVVEPRIPIPPFILIKKCFYGYIYKVPKLFKTFIDNPSEENYERFVEHILWSCSRISKVIGTEEWVYVLRYVAAIYIHLIVQRNLKQGCTVYDCGVESGSLYIRFLDVDKNNSLVSQRVPIHYPWVSEYAACVVIDEDGVHNIYGNQ